MRVEKVNLSAVSASSFNKTSVSPSLLNKAEYDSVSFGRKENKPSFKERVVSFFKKTGGLTEEEETSEEIRCLVDDIGAISKKLNPQARVYTSFAKSFIKIGEMEGFANYTTYDKKNNKKLIFGRMDEQTGIPSTITTVNMNKGFKVEDVYTFYDGLNMFSVSSEVDDKTEVNFTFLNGKVICYRELDKDTGTIKEFVPTKEGFYYFDGKKDENDNVKEKNIEVVVSYKPSEKSTVFVVDDDGIPRNYEYDRITDFWKEV